VKEPRSTQTTPGIDFEAVANRGDLISALCAITQEWRDSLGIEEMGVLGSLARGSAAEASIWTSMSGLDV